MQRRFRRCGPHHHFGLPDLISGCVERGTLPRLYTTPMPLRTLIPASQIQARVSEIGRSIDVDYPDGILVLVCILKGASVFCADLARSITRDVFVDFMGISSYGSEKTSSGQVQLRKDLDFPIEGAHVLIVEDIVDSGVTLDYLTRVLAERRPLSLSIAAFLDKPERRQRPIQVKYVGFTIPDEFVVGYGLDHAERYRNLPDICILDE